MFTDDALKRSSMLDSTPTFLPACETLMESDEFVGAASCTHLSCSLPAFECHMHSKLVPVTE
jgi:hypothetical protein